MTVQLNRPQPPSGLKGQRAAHSSALDSVQTSLLSSGSSALINPVGNLLISVGELSRTIKSRICPHRGSSSSLYYDIDAATLWLFSFLHTKGCHDQAKVAEGSGGNAKRNLPSTIPPLI